METNQTAARAARRFLTDRVRDDWDWPTVPDYWSASDEEVRGVNEFRERYYGTTSPEPETDAEASAAADPYKFDSPDSIGDAVELKNQSRKRKRRAAQEAEMVWNEGLVCFVQRRDVWTGAAAVRKYGARRLEKEEPSEDATDASEEKPPEDEESAPTEPTPSEPAPLEPAVPPPETSSAKNDPADPLIPLAPPLLADNPIRTSIKPKIYTDIYNNIVVTQRTPAVPINLADMTRALVQGWKENGEWPPKAAPLDPLAGRKRAAVLGTRMENGDGPFLSHHPHMKKGMESVKRMFHLNGHHHENGEAGNNG